MNSLKNALIAAAAVATLALAGTANASLVARFQQVGANVVGDFSGTLTTTGFTPDALTTVGSIGVAPSSGVVAFAPPVNTGRIYLNVFSGPASFGSGFQTFANSGSGNVLYIDARYGALILDDSYVSGSALSGEQTYLNATFASMGITVGDYVYSLTSGETLTLGFGTAADAPNGVPEPGSLALAGLSLLALFGVRRRRA